MKYLIAMAIALTPGCVSFIEIPINEELDPPEWADDAITLVKHEWADHTRSFVALDEDITVRWFKGECVRFEEDDDYFNSYPGDCLLGYYATDWLGNKQIFIAVPSPDRQAHEISLSHEMLHWHLDVTGGYSDGNHKHSPHWAKVSNVEDTLAMAGM